MAMAAYLSVNNIEVIYDHVILVLKGVSLSVPEGRIVALLGANGAGKTTTLKAISNLLRAERGEVTKGSIEFRDTRIDRMETMTEAGQIFAARRVEVVDGGCRRCVELVPLAAAEHVVIEADRLLAGAAMHIVEGVDRRCHCTV